jgi:hypothetical protein
MSPLTRRYVKTSFAFLVAGLFLGAYLIVSDFLVGASAPRLLITAHVHLLLVGFMVMLVMGVATWMFPRPAAGDTRYRPGVAEVVYWLVTLSTVSRALAEILTALGTLGARPFIAAGGLGQTASAVLFVVNIWWRIRMPSAVRQ